MKRTKLSDRELPKYTKGEEIFNMVSHIVGGALAIVSILALIATIGIRTEFIDYYEKNKEE